MTTKALLLSLDQGTTSSRAIVFDKFGNQVALAQQEFPQIYPQEGWVEHNPEDIWQSTLKVAKEAIQMAEKSSGKVVAIGITNQRETTIVWNKKSLKPIYNGIVWQDRRTANYCKQLVGDNLEPLIQERTGLLADPYFSASKIRWILDNVNNAREQANKGELAFGTIDSFLLNRLTGGTHATDSTNACRTSLFDIHNLDWDSELLKTFDIPDSLLPKVHPCTADFGVSQKSLFGREIPILGMIGDQHAATVGQACFQSGDSKSTYGTGCFILTNTGNEAKYSKHRLLTTLAYQIGNTTHYAIEGSIFMAGAIIQWLRDGLGIIKSAKETEALAKNLSSNGGVYLVPGFTGLGAPHWIPEARGSLFGLTRASGPAEIARAALESVSYQSCDLLEALIEDEIDVSRLRVDGGMSNNQWLMQFLSDTTDLTVDVPVNLETTALGAAYVAGLQAGVFSDLKDITDNWKLKRQFTPKMPAKERQDLRSHWKKALASTINF
jgi:glycerol kinase